MSILSANDTIAIVGCSNGQQLSYKEKITNLLDILHSLGLNTICSPYIYETNSPFSGESQLKGEAFMDIYKNPAVKAIFDISGGDIANEVLEYLDYGYISKNPKPIFGYSDLTTVLCAIYSQCNIPVYLYQIRNLINSNGENQKIRIINSLLHNENDLFDFSYRFVQGDSMEGIVVGGNIRCLLKLAGTKYFPDFTDKILFLESMGGESGLMSAFLNQLKQIGVFNQIKGIILGTFSAMQDKNISPTIEELTLKIIDNKDIPIVKTEEIGHGANSKCLIIGNYISLT